MFARLFAVFALSVMLAAPAMAETPCQPRGEDWFAKRVCLKSDLVAVGEVRASGTSLMRGQPWTQIVVEEVLFSRRQPRQQIILRGWDANDGMRYRYEPGRRLLLWLVRDGADYRLAEDDWDSCAPSVWALRDDGMAFRPYDADGSGPHHVTLQTVRDYLAKQGR